MATTVRLPITILNPQSSSNAGNSFFSVAALTNWDAGHWEFVKTVQGNVFGLVHIPHNMAVTPNASIILTIAANATTGVTVLQIGCMRVPNLDSTNTFNASFTTQTAQNITVPGTAYERSDVTFTSPVTPVADDVLVVEILHNGASGSDTLAVNTLMFEATLQIDLT